MESCRQSLAILVALTHMTVALSFQLISGHSQPQKLRSNNICPRLSIIISLSAADFTPPLVINLSLSERLGQGRIQVDQLFLNLLTTLFCLTQYCVVLSIVWREPSWLNDVNPQQTNKFPCVYRRLFYF